MDIDGTLTNSEKRITDATKQVLLRAQSLGITLVLASGRPTSGLVDLGAELQMDAHHGLFVSFNGSQIVDCETNEILYNKPMRVEDGQAVLEHVKQFSRVRPMIDKGEYLHVTDVYDCYIDWQNQNFNVFEYEARGGHYKLCEQDDLAVFADYPLNKILTTGDPAYLQANYEAMMAPFKDSLNCTFTSPFFFEFTAKGIDKAKALEAVLIPRGFKREEMIAFGDGHNDITMLEYVGIGVAMGNAEDEVKNNADEVTRSNDEDGIAVALARHIPELALE